MTLDEFRASSQPCPDAILELLHEGGDTMPCGQSAVAVYDGSYVLYCHGGLFWVMAWWYPPLSYATLAKAEAALWDWHNEWF